MQPKKLVSLKLKKINPFKILASLKRYVRKLKRDPKFNRSLNPSPSISLATEKTLNYWIINHKSDYPKSKIDNEVYGCRPASSLSEEEYFDASDEAFVTEFGYVITGIRELERFKFDLESDSSSVQSATSQGQNKSLLKREANPRLETDETRLPTSDEF